MPVTYDEPRDCPATIPLFPLAGALLLPRARLPLNVFEPRYLAMVDAALAGGRMIGMVQPAAGDAAPHPDLCRIGCAGQITQFAETGDGRYLVTLTGVSRFALLGEDEGTEAPFRQARVDFSSFAADFRAGAGEAGVDRAALVAALRDFTAATGLTVDWKSVEDASSEALVNALSMLAPFGAREKQALLEAPDLGSRAETLVALARIEIARPDAAAGSRTLQ